MKRTTQLLVASAFVLAACNVESPVQADDHSHMGGLTLSSLSQSATAQTLDDLRRLTAKFHDLDAAEAARYSLFSNPLTAPDGCISSATEGGMGYHYSRLDNLGDDAVTLLD